MAFSLLQDGMDGRGLADGNQRLRRGQARIDIAACQQVMKDGDRQLGPSSPASLETHAAPGSRPGKATLPSRP